VLIFGSWIVNPEAAQIIAAPSAAPSELTNTHALGQLLYTEYVYLFQAAGLVLLIAMIGAIVLTLRRRPEVRRQRIAEQVSRPVEDVIEIKDIPKGSGI
jgi:NADH-quinone oxidoreductase subunit J